MEVIRRVEKKIQIGLANHHKTRISNRLGDIKIKEDKFKFIVLELRNIWKSVFTSLGFTSEAIAPVHAHLVCLWRQLLRENEPFYRTLVVKLRHFYSDPAEWDGEDELDLDPSFQEFVLSSLDASRPV